MRYLDGSESKIVTTLDTSMRLNGQLVALVGSILENGDMIVSAPHRGGCVKQFAGDMWIRPEA